MMNELSTHLLDVDSVGEQHGQAVQAHAPACCGRKAILQAADKALIHMHGLIVSLGLVLHQQGLMIWDWLPQMSAFLRLVS